MVNPPLIDSYDLAGLTLMEDRTLRTALTVERMVEVPNGRGGVTLTKTTLGPYWVSYTPVAAIQMPRILEDQAQGRVAYWIKYPLGLDLRADDALIIAGRRYTLATEYDPPPSPRAQVAIMWRKQD